MTDWRERFRARVVYWTAPAAGNRRRAVAVSNRSGIAQLYSWDVESGELTQVTDRPTGAFDGAISADGQTIYHLDDEGGNELGHWAALPAGGGGRPIDLTPALPRYASGDMTASRDGRRLAFTAAMDDGFTVFVLTAGASGEPGEPRPIYRHDGLCHVIGFDHSGERLGILTTERSGQARYSLLVVDTATGERVAELWDGEASSISRPTFSPMAGDQRVVAASDASGERRALIWDPGSGARLELPTDGPGEIFPWDWSGDGREILLCRVANAVQQLSIYELESGRLRALDHPSGVYGFYGENGTWFGHDGIVGQWQDARHPATVILLDRRSGNFVRELLAPGPVPPSRPWRSVTFTVDDGQPIQAWLAVPAGEGPFPAVIETHGGPESVAMEAFAPRAQAWVDHGFAFLSVNYRGSTTFGREFKEAIWGRVGELEVRDIVAGRAWLVEQGIGRPTEIFLTGWSYGGYLTLQALGVAPGLWAGGMAGVAVADWVSQYEDENDVLRAYDRALFGGSPTDKPDAYRRPSPLTYVEQVDAPVLIIQGRNDTRCPARQVELYETRMRELGKPIEVIWFDAGHLASADVELAIEHQAQMLDFAQRVLSERRGTEAS
jgi:dipeptidyl aminopeptidase/acylaminoacyl peptidase